jgi:hypothetical protein
MQLTQTAHFEARVRQRGIRSDVVDTILDFGSCRRVGGADSYFMDKTARAMARSALGAKAYAQLEHQLDLYIIAGDDGSLVTVAHRLQRCKH